MVAAVVLAAGGGTRFFGATHKLRALVSGRAIVVHAVAAAVASELETFVVTGAVDLTDLFGDEVTLVHNPDWAQGQATSARVGIDAAHRAGHEAVVLGLGDQPFLSPFAWRAIGAAASPLAVATYDGTRGHPVKIGRDFWDELPTDGDVVGRSVLALHGDLVEQIACVGQPTDIDTLEELSRWS